MTFSEIIDLVYILACIAVPFGMGIIAGREWPRRNPPTLEHKLGDLITSTIMHVMERRKWVQPGSGVEISKTWPIKMQDGRTVEIIVREIV